MRLPQAIDLTTVRQPLDAMVEAAVARLCERLSTGSLPPRRVVLPNTLTVAAALAREAGYSMRAPGDPMDTDLNTPREEICAHRAAACSTAATCMAPPATSAPACCRGRRGFLITPTDASLGCLEPARLAWVGDDGVQCAGGDRASKTLALHRRIYQARAARRLRAAHAFPPPERR